MFSGVSGNLSALRAYGTRMGVIAGNVANVNTDGFKKRRAVLQEGANRSVEAHVQQIDTPGAPCSAVEGNGRVERQMSNVDLSEEFPAMLTTRHAYGSNLEVVKTRDEMLGSLLDIVG